MKYIKLFEEYKDDNKILIIKDKNQLILTDINYKVLSNIQISEMDKNTFYVGGVASEKGLRLGYSLYIYMMMNIYPKKLMPSRDGDVREGAWKIWERLYNNNDIEKELLDMDDENYSISILTGNRNDTGLSKEEVLEFIESEKGYNENVVDVLNIFNTKYSIKPDKFFKENIIDMKNLPSDIQKKLSDDIDYFFSSRYE